MSLSGSMPFISCICYKYYASLTQISVTLKYEDQSMRTDSKMTLASPAKNYTLCSPDKTRIQEMCHKVTNVPLEHVQDSLFLELMPDNKVTVTQTQYATLSDSKDVSTHQNLDS